MADKGLERIIKSLRVKCIRHSSDCTWEGELSTLEDHLKRDKREGDCPYAIVECRHTCGYKDERIILSEHETSHCPLRPHQCVYCAKKSTYSDVVNEHTKVCERYPITCPNGCNEATLIERRLMSEHVDNECPVAIVACDYWKEGCGWKGQRLHSDDHCSKECQRHLKLVYERTKKLEKENDGLKREIKQLNYLTKTAASELRKQSGDIERLQTQIRQLQLKLP